ncbi:alpha/beta-hydrolase [Macrolepiota fuliginosa MF-IS2]|uniref:Alpha/beta-hydrolase n=1 Tax=Macrolepiota fuliginosa MF-IS2 TaxID=1400762 RepID=A0A9P5XG66_9AGAR|nr:alpha/beta-hydrolase [Macrolepiota fuliginosa MF-IS2]
MNLDPSTIYEPRLVKSADGTEICTDAAGNRAPNCPVIVLLHGFSVVKEAFDPMFVDPLWTRNAFLVRYDIRGHGKSSKPLADDAWASERMSEDFEAVCKEFGVAKAFVLGWSLGGMAVRSALLQRTDGCDDPVTQFADIIAHNVSVEISGLINVEGPPYIDAAIISRVSNSETLAILGALAQPTSVDDFQETTLQFVRRCSNVISPDLCRVLLEGVIVQPRAVTGRLLSRQQNPEKLLQGGRDGKLDVLIVSGGEDRMVGVEGLRAVYEEIGWKKCSFKHLDKADHIPWASSAEAFRDAVLGWVKGR